MWARTFDVYKLQENALFEVVVHICFFFFFGMVIFCICAMKYGRNHELEEFRTCVSKGGRSEEKSNCA